MFNIIFDIIVRCRPSVGIHYIVKFRIKFEQIYITLRYITWRCRRGDPSFFADGAQIELFGPDAQSATTTTTATTAATTSTAAAATTTTTTTERSH